jgi:hypothetical protein
MSAVTDPNATSARDPLWEIDPRTASEEEMIEVLKTVCSG